MYNEDIESAPTYLIDSEAGRFREEAEKVLEKAKLQESKKKIIPVWVDHNTTKLMDMEKIKKRKLEIIRVKMGKGELVWMERKTAIKNGFICE